MNRHLPYYPQAFGTRKMTVVDHYGPSSYQTGGEQILAPPLGFGSIDLLNLPSPSLSSSGNYTVAITYPQQNAQPTAYVTMRWYVLGSGAEVTAGTDLSAEVIRMQVLGG